MEELVFGYKCAIGFASRVTRRKRLELIKESAKNPGIRGRKVEGECGGGGERVARNGRDIDLLKRRGEVSRIQSVGKEERVGCSCAGRG